MEAGHVRILLGPEDAEVRRGTRAAPAVALQAADGKNQEVESALAEPAKRRGRLVVGVRSDGNLRKEVGRRFSGESVADQFAPNDHGARLAAESQNFSLGDRTGHVGLFAETRKKKRALRPIGIRRLGGVRHRDVAAARLLLRSARHVERHSVPGEIRPQRGYGLFQKRSLRLPRQFFDHAEFDGRLRDLRKQGLRQKKQEAGLKGGSNSNHLRLPQAARDVLRRDPGEGLRLSQSRSHDEGGPVKAASRLSLRPPPRDP